MARNAEKAMTTLARWRAAQLQEGGGEKERRPYLATECNDLPRAEKWRIQIIREISKKVAQIQNAGLGEFRIRDLNDEINKLLREKRHWEIQIRELGGPDYLRFGPRMLDHEGKEVPGNRGYKYFGAAKELPGVRELFEQCAPPAPRRTRGDLMKYIDADYYGYRDDDDGILIPLEQIEEKRAIEEEISKWKEGGKSSLVHVESDEEDIYAPQEHETGIEEDDDDKTEMEGNIGEGRFVAHVPVPSQKEIEEALIRRRKMELLQRYASEDLMKEEKQSKELLGMTYD